MLIHIRRALFATGLVAISLLALPVGGATPAAAGTIHCGINQSNEPDIASAFQTGVRHSGAATDSTVLPPLVEKWTYTFPGPASYVTIAQGKVAVVASTTLGTRLYVLDSAASGTGSVLWSAAVPGGSHDANPAFDKGCIIVLDSTGRLTEWTLDTGVRVFSIQLPGLPANSVCGPPVARQNKIFASCGDGTTGDVFAISEANGNILWDANVVNGITVNSGQYSSPTLTHGFLQVSYNCGQVYQFNWLTGVQNWHQGGATGCPGGVTMMFGGQLLYSRDEAAAQPQGTIRDKDTGGSLGQFTAGSMPSGYNLIGLTTMPDGTIRKFNNETGALITTWNPPTGDTYVTPSIIAGGKYVFVGGASGTVYALKLTQGTVVWSASAHAPIPAIQEQSSAQPLSGLNLGEGLLVVPAGNTVTAFGP